MIEFTLCQPMATTSRQPLAMHETSCQPAGGDHLRSAAGDVCANFSQPMATLPLRKDTLAAEWRCIQTGAEPSSGKASLATYLPHCAYITMVNTCRMLY